MSGHKTLTEMDKKIVDTLAILDSKKHPFFKTSFVDKISSLSYEKKVKIL